MYSIPRHIPNIPVETDMCVAKSQIPIMDWSQVTLQFEPAVVLDIVLDNSHVLFNNVIDGKLTVKTTIITPDYHPENYKGERQSPNSISYVGIGTILARLCHSQQNIDKKDVVLAHPIDNSITTYPLMNELVQVVEYLGVYYYTNKIPILDRKFVNSNADFRLEQTYGKNNGNIDYNGKDMSVNRTTSMFCSSTSTAKKEMSGVLGTYFKFNPRLRYLKRREGDTIIESRFGQSMRFGAYDDNRKNDIGEGNDYKNGGGNPFILIRNKQRLLAKDNEQSLHEKLNTIKDIKSSPNEVDVTGYMTEDVNNDGSSIHITSGLTTSEFKTTCYKSIFSSDVKEEQPAFSPMGSTKFKMPVLNGNQIVIHSDRLIFSSRFNETFHYSKKRYSVVTDSEYTVDAHDQIVFTTNSKTVFNSPVIFLGEYDSTGEPALLGQTAVNWMYELCNWLLEHTHWYKHTHPRSGGPSPQTTQLPVEIQRLQILRDSLHKLLSRRVFITGGGFSIGKDGEQFTNGKTTSYYKNIPIEIDVVSGDGVPGGFNGKSFREK